MEPEPRPLEVALVSNRFLKIVLMVTLSLLGILIVGYIFFVLLFPEKSQFFSRAFDVDNEGNWSTWFNSTLNLFAGLSAWLVAWLVNRQSPLARPWLRRWDVWGWVLTGGVLAYTGMDDTAQIHEGLSGFVANVIYALKISNPIVYQFRYYMWIPFLGIPAAGLMLALAYYVWRPIWNVSRARWLVLLGLALLLSNLLTETVKSRIIVETGVQTMEELYQAHHDQWLVRQSVSLVQEISEMGGMLFFLAGFLMFGQSLVVSFSASHKLKNGGGLKGGDISSETIRQRADMGASQKL